MVPHSVSVAGSNVEVLSCRCDRPKSANIGLPSGDINIFSYNQNAEKISKSLLYAARTYWFKIAMDNFIRMEMKMVQAVRYTEHLRMAR